MTKITARFENQQVYVGLVVHKRSWNAVVYLNEQFIHNIHQPPQPQALYHYLTHTYPGARYSGAYECGKFGYWIQRQLQKLGVECIAINPADIPSTHKDEVYKNDSRDAKGIGYALSK